jgi:hypothetical protein
MGTGCGRAELRDWFCPAEVPMAKQDDYRNYARDAVRLASHATSTAKKSLLLALAERWLDLADAQDVRAKANHGLRMIDGDAWSRTPEEHQQGE